jgi:hypothetical protein
LSFNFAAAGLPLLLLAGSASVATNGRSAGPPWLLVLEWSESEGKATGVLAFRDGSGDVFTARDIVKEAFEGERFRELVPSRRSRAGS